VKIGGLRFIVEVFQQKSGLEEKSGLGLYHERTIWDGVEVRVEFN
jgi:hypothetical protein